MKKPNIKILVSYHKPDIMLKNEILEPIHVGRANAKKDNQYAFNTLSKIMIGDNTGENISNKNGSYNEMTATYWAWKNYDKIGNPNFIGFMHYRRHFIFEKRPKIYYECNSFNDKYISENIKCTKQNVLACLNKGDFICSMPYSVDSVYGHYKAKHRIEDLDCAMEIIKKKFPKYAKATSKYMKSQKAYFCNMFVFNRRDFFEYCEFVFGVLKEYEQINDIKGKRLFISERLTGVFIQYLLDKKKKGVFLATQYLEEQTIIPIAFATDLSYLAPTSVAITSIAENARKNVIYDINVLASVADKKRIEETLMQFDGLYNNVKINVLEIDKRFDKIKMKLEHITFQTYFRLLLPELLPQYGKCIYLDSDLIVENDLVELFRTNIDEFLIAGVKAAGYLYPPAKAKENSSKLNIADISNYINAGMILMNLKRMRVENYVDKFLKLINKNFPSQDQDILNVACYGNIKILELRYNLMTKYFKCGEPDNIAKNVYSESDIKNAMEKPQIIHYADKVKPWQDSGVYLFSKWNYYNLLSPLVRNRRKAKISIIVPTYNMEEYIAECLDSILAQTLKDIEVVCINDGSKDASLEIMTKYANKDSRVTIINQANKGVGASRNIGLKYANSEFVAFMDPDDLYPSLDVLESLYAGATNNKVNVCGGSWSEVFEGKIIEQFSCVNKGYVFEKDQLIKYSDYQFDYGFHRFIYNVDMLKSHKIQFPTYTRFQDPPFFLKAMTCAGTFYGIKKQTYRYRIGHQDFTKWSSKKVCDLLLGLIDNLRISERYNLKELHFLTVKRLNEHGKIFDMAIERNDNLYVVELLIRANIAINRKITKEIDHKYNENYITGSLRKVAYNKPSRTKVDNKQKSLGQLIKGFFICLKNNGLKYTLIRTKIKVKKILKRVLGVKK